MHPLNVCLLSTWGFDCFDCIGLPPFGRQFGNRVMVDLKALCTIPAAAIMFALSSRQLDRGSVNLVGVTHKKRQSAPLWLQACLEEWVADRSLELDRGSQRIFKA